MSANKPAQSSSPSSPEHPFANSTKMLEVIPSRVDIEEEARLYDELCDDPEATPRPGAAFNRPPSPAAGPPSIFSRESIWLGDNSGECLAFARDVDISGWTNVGERLGGGYVVYDCAIKTKEGTMIHVHRRYSAFVELETKLRKTLPRHLQHFVPSLPPRNPLARFRPAFLNRRRCLLQYWLSAVLLHPDIGGCKAVRAWVTN